VAAYFKLLAQNFPEGTEKPSVQ